MEQNFERIKKEVRKDIIDFSDLCYWSEELNLQVEELKEIVKIVGPSLHDVRLYLTKRSILLWTLAY